MAEDELMDTSTKSEFSSLCELTESQRQVALDRYRIIEPFIEGNKSLSRVCQENNLSLRTAREWVGRYRKGGLSALARMHRKDKGKHRRLPLELQQLIEGLYLKSSHLSFASIYRQVKQHQENLQRPYPKYRTLCTLLNQIPESMTTLAHQGSKQYSRNLIYCACMKPINRMPSGKPIMHNLIFG